jgi:hypothetical protein
MSVPNPFHPASCHSWFRCRLRRWALAVAALPLLLLAAACAGDEIGSLPEAQGGDGVAPLRLLLVDDDEGLAGTVAWSDTLEALGLPYDVDVVPPGGDPAFPLENYRVVIWSVGDRAYDNLMPGNIGLLVPYLANGGRLLYAGGHSVYSEFQIGAGEFIDTYLGLAGYTNHMPTFLNIAAPAYTTGSGHAAVGSAT